MKEKKFDRRTFLKGLGLLAGGLAACAAPPTAAPASSEATKAPESKATQAATQILQEITKTLSNAKPKETATAIPITERGGPYSEELEAAINRGDFTAQQTSLNGWFFYTSQSETPQFNPQTKKKTFEYVPDSLYPDKAGVVMQTIKSDNTLGTYSVPVDTKTGKLRWTAPLSPDGVYEVAPGDAMLELTRSGRWSNGSEYELKWRWDGKDDNLGTWVRVDATGKFSGVIAFGDGKYKDGDLVAEGGWVNIESTEIDGQLPEAIREQISGVKILRNEKGDVYAQEAYANIDGKQVLMLVKQGGDKWIMAPYGLGLPKKDGHYYEWGPMADKANILDWNSTPVSGTNASTKEKITGVLSILEYLKMTEDQERGIDNLPGAQMYFEKMLTGGMDIIPDKKQKVWEQFASAILDSNLWTDKKYWQEVGGKPDSPSDWLKKLSTPGGPLNKPGWIDHFHYMGANPPGRRREGDISVYLGDINFVIATTNGPEVKGNVFAKAFTESLILTSDLIKVWEGPISAQYGICRDANGRLVFAVIDLNVTSMINAEPVLMGKQTIGDMEGNILPSAPQTVSDLYLATLEYNKIYTMESKKAGIWGNFVPYSLVDEQPSQTSVAKYGQAEKIVNFVSP